MVESASPSFVRLKREAGIWVDMQAERRFGGLPLPNRWDLPINENLDVTSLLDAAGLRTDNCLISENGPDEGFL